MRNPLTQTHYPSVKEEDQHQPLNLIKRVITYGPGKQKCCLVQMGLQSLHQITEDSANADEFISSPVSYGALNPYSGLVKNDERKSHKIQRTVQTEPKFSRDSCDWESSEILKEALRLHPHQRCDTPRPFARICSEGLVHQRPRSWLLPSTHCTLKILVCLQRKLISLSLSKCCTSTILATLLGYFTFLRLK